MEKINTTKSLKNILSDESLNEMADIYRNDDEFEEWLCAKENAKRVEPKGEHPFECLKCGNTQQIWRWDRESQTRQISDCECKKVRVSFARLDKSGICRDWDTKTLDNFHTAEEWQRTMKRGVETYISKAGVGDWFLLSGQSGTGKTHLCTAEFVTLVRTGRSGEYVTWGRLMQQMDAEHYHGAEYDKIIDRLTSCDVLYLDDLFKTQKDAGISARAFDHTMQIIDARHNDPERITIISTEWTLSELAKQDEAFAGRIVERCNGNIIQIPRDTGRNYRFNGKKS